MKLKMQYFQNIRVSLSVFVTFFCLQYLVNSKGYDNEFQVRQHFLLDKLNTSSFFASRHLNKKCYLLYIRNYCWCLKYNSILNLVVCVFETHWLTYSGTLYDHTRIRLMNFVKSVNSACIRRTLLILEVLQYCMWYIYLRLLEASNNLLTILSWPLMI